MLTSPNFNDRTQPLDMVVLHYTGMPTAQEAVERLCSSAAKVSAHYLIDADGTVVPLVDEEKRAWHAGVSFWKGITDINSRSIGIELVNKGHEFGYTSFPQTQTDALISVLRGIFERYKIPFYNVLGHSDVAPLRKCDPGELFDWRSLSEKGFGAWTDAFSSLSGSRSDALSAIGYDVTDEQAALTAFQRHFYPETLLYPDGKYDLDGRLAAVAELFRSFSR